MAEPAENRLLITAPQEALRAITPEMLKNYLLAHHRSWRTEADYRRNSPLPPADILVPTRGSADYAHRMWDAVNALARIEDRSQLDIYCELVGKPTYEELERELEAHKLALPVACEEQETSGGDCPLKDGSLLRRPFGNRYGDAACCEKEAENCYPALLLVWARERIKGGPDWRDAKCGKEGE